MKLNFVKKLLEFPNFHMNKWLKSSFIKKSRMTHKKFHRRELLQTANLAQSRRLNKHLIVQLNCASLGIGIRISTIVLVKLTPKIK